MRKWLVWAIIVAAVGSWVVYNFDIPYSKNISRTFQGVQLQLGATDNGSKPVILKLEGKMHRSIRGNFTYKGTILVNGEGLSMNDHGLRIEFTKYGRTLSGYMIYEPVEFSELNDKGTPIFRDSQYVEIFTDEDMDQVAIEVVNQQGGWSSQEGDIIVAPALDRADAIVVAKSVTKGYSDKLFGDLSDRWLQ